MTAAEHLEEAARLMGWAVGVCRIELFVKDGHLEKAIPHGGPVGRNEMHERRRDLSESDSCRG